MGRLQEVEKGIYLLDVKIGKLHLKKLFQDVDESKMNPDLLNATTHKTDDFYLFIPDVEEK